MMSKNNDSNLTDKNLDRLADFLNQELAHPTLGSQIPDGAHIFHGSSHDKELTQGNLNLATKLLLGMTLGYVEEAPLVMLFEYGRGKQTVVNLSETIQKQYVQTFIGQFQQQSQKKMRAKIEQLAAVA